MAAVRLAEPVIKSAADEREYRHITLPNKLQVLLSSDDKTEKSSAALDVNVGHFSDPEEAPGLAHFCEHMLFLGTEKYPDEAEYNAYLNQNGGMSNAVILTACCAIYGGAYVPLAASVHFYGEYQLLLRREAGVLRGSD